MTYDFSVLRGLRKKHGLTINGLSEKCGVSYVALSKLERNQGNPELRTLDRIARALDLPTHHLLALAEGKLPIRAKEQKRKVLGEGQCQWIDLDGTRICLVTAPKGARGNASEMHRNDYEHCYVLDGKLRVQVRGTDYQVGSGEGLVWDCFFDHEYEALQDSQFVCVLSPKRP